MRKNLVPGTWYGVERPQHAIYILYILFIGIRTLCDSVYCLYICCLLEFVRLYIFFIGIRTLCDSVLFIGIRRLCDLYYD